jgi:hypothetical protein
MAASFMPMSPLAWPGPASTDAEAAAAASAGGRGGSLASARDTVRMAVCARAAGAGQQPHGGSCRCALHGNHTANHSRVLLPLRWVALMVSELSFH